MSYEADPGFLSLTVSFHGSQAGDGRHVRNRRKMCHGSPGFSGALFISESWLAGVGLPGQ
jgi:hypothetical protein